MQKFVAIIFASQLLASCAAMKDITTATGAFDAFQGQIDVAPAFFVSVAADYEKTSKEYYNLTGGTCDNLQSQAIQRFKNLPLVEKIKGKKPRTLTYEEYEKKRLDIKSYSIKFLNQYAAEMKRRVQEAADFSTGLGYATTGADIVEEIPVIGAQAKPYSAAAKAIIAVLDKFHNDATAAAITQTARETDGDLEKIVLKIKDEFGVINKDAKIYLDAWDACRTAKIKAIRGPIAGLGPTSPYEYDAAYSASLQQYIDFKKAIPTVDNELDAILAANKKIAKGDFATSLTAAQEMVAAANATYKAVKAVPNAGM